MNTQKPLIFIPPPFTHHARGAGITPLIDQFPAAHVIGKPKRLLQMLLPTPVAHRLTRQIGSNWYGSDQLQLEITVYWNMLKTSSPSLYHYLSLHDNYGFLGKRKSCHKLIGTMHQPPAISEKIHKRKSYLSGLDAICIVAECQREFLLTHRYDGLVEHIPLGIDAEFYMPGEVPNSHSTFRVLFLGQWLRDFDFLEAVIDAFKGNNAFRFIVIAPELHRSRFEQKVNVEFKTNLSSETLREEVRNCQALFLPLTDATANSSMLMSMSCGLPVVATKLSGVKEYSTPECALLYERNRIDDCLDALHWLHQNPDQAYNMGLCGRERVLEHYHWPIIARKHADLYHRL